MKYTLFILYFLCSFSYGQTLKGVITFTAMRGVGDDTKLSEKAKKPMFYGYTYSNGISTQELVSKEGTTIDTIFIELEGIKDRKYETTTTTIRPQDAIFYKNYNTNIYRYENSKKNHNLVTEYLSIKDEIPSYIWTFEAETQKIAGYNCKKAITTKKIGARTQNITAWYTEDIPINDGPMDFNGLPGLIIQIEIDKNAISRFEKIKFYKNKTIEIKEPKNNAEFLTLNEYIEKMANGRRY